MVSLVLEWAFKAYLSRTPNSDLRESKPLGLTFQRRHLSSAILKAGLSQFARSESLGDGRTAVKFQTV